jgi:SPP1 gp7 family putative phage head morphogenesis protein
VLTEEAVKECAGLADEVVESIIRVLKDEAIYQEHPRVLARRILDLWGGERYRAVRWARTFSADVATNTTLYRYKQQGIEECQFYARIDGRTSPQCRMLHGTIFKVGSTEAGKYHPPAHPHCRSTLIPVTSFTEVDDSLRFENRNFEQSLNQDLKPLKEGLDGELVKNTFKNIDKFNEKYRIDKFILDEDIEKRLSKLGVEIST